MAEDDLAVLARLHAEFPEWVVSRQPWGWQALRRPSPTALHVVARWTLAELAERLALVTRQP